MEGGRGIDVANGGDGIDQLIFDTFGNLGTITLDLALTTAQNTGAGSITVSSIENIQAVAFDALTNFILYGTTGSNYLDGSNGVDQLYGREGDDTLRGRGGADFLNGGDGFDFVSYVGTAVAVTVNLSSGASGIGGWAQGDTFFSIEGLSGGSGNDNLTGHGIANTLYGGLGLDILNGLDGNDSLWNGASYDFIGMATEDNAVDTLNGGNGDDNIYVNRGDIANGGAGYDRVYASFFGNASALNIDLTSNIETQIETLLNVQLNDIEEFAVYGTRFDDVITAGVGAQRLFGGAGNNTLNGGEGDDQLSGDYGNDILNGQGGNDLFYYVGGNDVLDGGTGDDTFQFGSSLPTQELEVAQLTIIGGDGFDSIDFFRAPNGAIFSMAAGPQVFLGGTVTTTGVERLLGSAGADIFTGSAAGDTLNGNGGNDTLNGADGDDNLDGGLGIDTMVGGLGSDTYTVDNAADVVTEANVAGVDTVFALVSYTLSNTSFVERLTLLAGATNGIGNNIANVITGNDAANRLEGRNGDDTLDGGLGVDTMIGGTGNDTYYADNASDVATELDGEGTDTVIASVTYTLSNTSFIERLTLLEGVGVAPMNATGNNIANVITGNSGNNTIDGRKGADTMIGGLGDDTYIVDNTGDIATEANGQGYDTVQSSVSFVLGSSSFVEALILTGTAAINGTGNNIDNVITGNSGANTLDGRKGNDVLDGGAGIDTMIGGLGDDTFYVDNAADVATELKDEGEDTVIATVSYALSNTSYVENLALGGTSAIDGIGNDIANTLFGNDGNNRLEGRKGNDILIGGGGIDTMLGGTGNDTYFVDNAADLATELDGEGTDTVYASVSYALSNSSYVEQLVLTGELGLNATGNNIANVITGNVGNNTIDGRKGADTMIGGLGDDTYIVDNAGDIVTELLDQGTDTVIASVSYVLSNTSFIEALTLSGAANINATGNNIANVITGNDGNNVIDGKKGADTMIGGGGNDTYYVDNVGDVVTEANVTGTDTIISSVTYALSNTSFVEGLTLTGTANLNATGNNVANTIVGNSGNNLIIGLRGADALTGGAGADTFKFNALNESSGSSIDRITDLSDTDDFINLAGDQAFVLASAFTNTAGQAVLSFDAGTGLTSLSLDVNGDSVADMLIQMNGNHTAFTQFIY